MPIICEFWGFKVYMYYQDHLPPHFHVRGRGTHAVISLPDGALLAGDLPSGIASHIAAWVQENAEALMENWRRARCKEPLLKVPSPKRGV
ncbi:DUF4160 domain-containing protein [Syntrophothermus lipocalidus]|uniref:Transcriptional regulator n=1 Tax=Syntrophothermus lipocalidus (strain DSM 12680 / TGB-C1) TaxID=643648 RepID=D7CPY2_SYNLT|nr:DUF4160 domain-containing protein [Syntrophothermus lipocalidus]ADI02760.1 conserved hypothetical protein [Syntrophothermus lipocalidus DSM 12680]